MGLEQDYILRIVRQMTELMLRVTGLKKSGREDEAIEVIHQAHLTILGIPFEVLDRIDVASAAMLLGDSHRIEAAAQLAYEEGEIERVRAATLAAERRFKRSLDLLEQAEKMAPRLSPESEALRSRLGQLLE